MTGDINGYPLEKFIHGIVAKLIRSYKMNDFKIESSSGRVDSDFRQDMIQTAWVAVLQAQKSPSFDPKRPDAAHYLRRAIVNSLLKFEQADRYRRDNRDDLDEAESHEAKPTVDTSGYDLSLLLDKAELTPAESVAVKLFYGLFEDFGECTLRQISHLMDKPEHWVEQRISVAKLKLQVAAGK